MNLSTKVSLALICMAGPGLAEPIDGTERYFEFPNALPGKIMKAHKAFDPATGKIGLVTNLPEVSSISDLLSVEAVEEAKARSEHGTLHPPLAGKMKDLGNRKIRVVVKLKPHTHGFLDKTRHSREELIANSLELLGRGPMESPLSLSLRHGLAAVDLKGLDMLVADVRKADLEALKIDPNVASVWEEVEEQMLAPELPTLAASGYNPGAVPSGAGSGARAATFEYGLTSSFLSCAGITPASYDTFPYGAPFDVQKRHSQATFRTLAASAPGASLYHRNSQTYNTSGDVNYLSNNAIQTVSMSLTRGNTTPYRSTYSEFLTMDNMAYSYPFPVFVNPSGNAGYAYEVNWQCYNCLSVGNVRHTGDSYFEMADCTQTKNPPPRYGYCISGSGADCTGDREMPHVVAPGIPSSGSTFATTCLEGTGNMVCGSSLSAPVVNGLAADAIAADSRLSSWPEKTRATLILTAQNVESGDWSVSGDERDGTGTVSGSEAVSFAQSHTSVSPGNTACEKGMGATSMYASDFGSNKRYYFLVPNPKPSGKHLRVVLTWDSNPNVGNGTNDLSDMDLIVQSNAGTHYSSSWDSNVEVVDVDASNLTAGGSYYIDISPYANRIPSGAFFYYAIAWTWVKDHAP